MPLVVILVVLALVLFGKVLLDLVGAVLGIVGFLFAATLVLIIGEMVSRSIGLVAALSYAIPIVILLAWARQSGFALSDAWDFATSIPGILLVAGAFLATSFGFDWLQSRLGRN
jgi:hypothetical protein